MKRRQGKKGVAIEAVEAGSLGAQAGFQEGDRVLRINGQEVRDAIDFQVYSAEPWLKIEVERDGEGYVVELEREPGKVLGLTFEEIKPKQCNNRCIFCFIHQMPKGLRRSLYVADDDYRLSFLHGTYVTLTNVDEAEIDRIIEQRLSPQYISVHAIDPRLRMAMLGRKRPGVDIRQRIAKLACGGIEMHAQVVLCPGWNDGPSLERTVRELSAWYPRVRSVALVPVGLTRFREGLPSLAPVTPEKAEEYIALAEEWGQEFLRTLGERFVYVADELFLLIERDLPPASYYETFPQLENGVGMARSFLDTWEKGKKYLPQRVERPLRLALVTAQLASRFLRPIAAELNRIQGLEVEVIEVENDFFGPHIAVSGLLTGQDIRKRLQGRSCWDLVMLPPNCLNEEGLTLDDMTVPQLQEAAGVPLVVGQYDLAASLLACLRG